MRHGHVRTRRRSIAAYGLVALVALAAPAAAVEVRQPDGGSRYHADLTRAYAPCLAPNTTAFGGEPACSPAITSPCGYEPASVDLEPYDDFPPFMRLDAPPGAVTGPCDFADWSMQFGLRISTEEASSTELPCSSGRCTLHDLVDVRPLTWGPAGHLGLPYDYYRNANVEVGAIRIVDADGIPIVATGVGVPATARLVSNLTVPYPACPDEWCDLGPWAPPCDFESGELVWLRDAATGAPQVHATLRDVTGASPLCATGTYRVEATVRPTVYGCGDPAHPTLCTLVDRPVAVAFRADRRRVDAAGVIDIGSYPYRCAGLEVLESRVLDPTGAVVASPGVTGVRPTPETSIVVKGTALKLRSFIDIRYASVDPTVSVDPTLDGLTVRLADRDGLVWEAAIPATGWQLQPPMGERWDYRDQGGRLAGVRKARLQRVSKKGVVLGYRLDVVARGADLSAADFPGLTVGIDVTSRSMLGGVAVLEVEGHRTCTGGLGKLTCK